MFRVPWSVFHVHVPFSVFLVACSMLHVPCCSVLRVPRSMFRVPCSMFMFRVPYSVFHVHVPCSMSMFQFPCSLLRVSCCVFLVPCSAFRVPCSVLFRVACSLFRVPCPCSVFHDPCSMIRVPWSVFRVPCSMFRALMRCVKCLKEPSNALGFINVISWHGNHRRVSTTHVAIYRVVCFIPPISVSHTVSCLVQFFSNSLQSIVRNVMDVNWMCSIPCIKLQYMLNKRMQFGIMHYVPYC